MRLQKAPHNGYKVLVWGRITAKGMFLASDDVMRLIVVLIGALAVSSCRAPSQPAPHARTSDIRLVPDSERVTGAVSPSATFADILAEHDVVAEHEQAFTAAVEPIFSSRQLKAHHTYELERGLDGRVRDFT
jgi:hypothetical protein